MLLKLRYNTILHIFALAGVALLDIACGCEDGWVPFQDSCYIAIPKPESWFDAMNLCTALYGYLVEMQSPELFILNYTRHLHPGVSQTPYRYWVGAHDLAVEGHWTWANSHQRINYSSWAPGEPNSYGGDQDCMEIQGYQNYLWDDNACDAKLFAICETEITMPFIIPIAAVVGSLVGVQFGVPAALSAVGFTTGGIAAGSTAAGMMSAAAVANGGGVAAGSTVAVLQSVGAVGGLATCTKAVVAAGAAVLAFLF